MSVLDRKPNNFWSPLDVASTAQPVMYTFIEKSTQSSAVDASHNSRGAKFAALQEALYSVSRLDSSDSFFLGVETCTRASVILGLISSNLNIAPPRFLPQDGEVAIFTWDTPHLKRLLTIDPEEVDLMDINKSNYMKCTHEAPENLDEQLSFVLNELGAGSSASNSYAGIDG